jgi:hypothetical protein
MVADPFSFCWYSTWQTIHRTFFQESPGVDVYTMGSNLISQQETNFCGY